MSSVLVLGRTERELIGVDFAADLDTAETITDVLDLIIYRRSDGEDVTAEFAEDAPVAPDINGNVVQLWKKPADTADEQARGLYRVYCRIETSNLRKPVGHNPRQKYIVMRITE